MDLLAQLDDVGRGDRALAALRREDIFVQGAPGNGQRRTNTVLLLPVNTVLYMAADNKAGVSRFHMWLPLLQTLINTSLTENIRSDFVAPHDERHLPAPGVDEGRPAGVDGHIFPIAGAHPQRCIVKRLPCKLKD